MSFTATEISGHTTENQEYSIREIHIQHLSLTCSKIMTLATNC